LAITQITIQTPSNEILFTDTNLGNAVDAVKASSCKILYAVIDNSLNAASSYLKMFNLASGSVTLGTTAADTVIFVPASSVVTVPFLTGAAPGVTFGTALSIACVTTGGTGGNTSPSSAVTCTISYI
jgi:hypothetical protein